MSEHHSHKSQRSGWLRAAVLGANDGIVSTASLIIGVSAADSSREAILLAGVAGLVAGALSMAAGEYVSVSSQADVEQADLALERRSLKHNREWETQELASIYRQRGLEPKLADEVARQLMDHDALEAHARDEIGITDVSRAQPLVAALSSAAMFTIGAGVPLLVTALVPLSQIIVAVSAVCLLLLVMLGVAAAIAGGASPWRGGLRVLVWGALAMGLSAVVGRLFGVVV
ncbi:VIT family protein [Spongiibacter nanhainus]|uniref:VIT family protein n=1 Tax=Spongiibacter nanhainus TaxID=2794344 RepID=A0A7T4UQ03_9GAMM|nr:VIT family protein [Spongiibacter nanhainus]QQD18228.1 VIT family protein [Spongiibacter nanhainus]